MPGVPSNAFAVNAVTMTGGAIQIVPARGDRKRVTLVMGGTPADTFLGPPGVSSANGILLAGVKGQTLFFETTAAIFGNGTAAAIVSYLEEFA